jgi:hypothetical protein
MLCTPSAGWPLERASMVLGDLSKEHDSRTVDEERSTLNSVNFHWSLPTYGL